MAVPTGVASNKWLLDRISEALDDINVGHRLRLFKNDFTPVPGSALADFTEADFLGYVFAPLDADFTGPDLIVDGEYQITSTEHSWSYISGPNQTVYGWYITKGTDWKFAYLFPFPFSIQPGTTLTLTVQPQDWALSIVP